jgi:hypothetical protein
MLANIHPARFKVREIQRSALAIFECKIWRLSLLEMAEQLLL